MSEASEVCYPHPATATRGKNNAKQIKLDWMKIKSTSIVVTRSRVQRMLVVLVDTEPHTHIMSKFLQRIRFNKYVLVQQSFAWLACELRTAEALTAIGHSPFTYSHRLLQCTTPTTILYTHTIPAQSTKTSYLHSQFYTYKLPSTGCSRYLQISDVSFVFEYSQKYNFYRRANKLTTNLYV